MATIKAHITGTVWKIEVKVGDTVSPGDVVVILESMKMEMPVEAEEGGTVTAINVGEALQYLKGGSPIRCLGQMTAARMSMAPDWPTFKESGYNYEMASLRGMAAPKGLPAAIRDRLVKAIAAAAADPAFKVAAEAAFAPVRYLSPQAYEAEIKAGDVVFRQLWKELPWTDK